MKTYKTLRVFLDANFLIAAGLRSEGDYHKVLSSPLDTLVTSEHVLMEVARNMLRLRTEPGPFILWFSERFEVTDRFDVLPPGIPLDGAGDRQALAEAIGAECDLFVTADQDFADLFGRSVKGVKVVKSREYVKDRLLGPSSE